MLGIGLGKLVIILVLIALFSLLSYSQDAFAGGRNPIPVTINDVSLEEGNPGDATIFTFDVDVTDFFCCDELRIAYETRDVGGTATEDVDYVGESGTLIIFNEGGFGSGTITIEIEEDTDFEDDETFFVVLTSCTFPVGVPCQFTKNIGIGTILNDDEEEAPSFPDDVYVVMGVCCNDIIDDGSLAIADLELGDLTQIGDPIAQQVERNGLSGLAIDSTGRFFVTAVGEGGFASILLEINGNTGEIINNVGPNTIDNEGIFDVKIRDLAFQPGTDILFGVGQVQEGGGTSNGLFTIDTSDATVDLKGTVDGSTIQGLAFAPDGTLYGANCDLFTLDIEDSEVVQNFVTMLDRCFDGLGIDSVGQIFGTTGADSLHLINPEDGSDVTVAGEDENPSDVDFISGSPFSPTIVEPGNSQIIGGDPTLGVQRNGILVQSDGFCFDLFCLDVFDYFNHLPIQQVNSGSTHTISLTAYCPSGSNRCNYASVGAAPPGTDINEVNWNIILKRIGLTDNWELIEEDQNDMLGTVVGTVQVIDASRIQYSFSIQFTTPASIGTPDGNAEPPEDNLILVTEIRDSNGGSNRNIFNEGVFVYDIYSYPQIEASYMAPMKVESLCLNEDPTKRYTCAFDKVRQWTIKQAEEKLQEIYNTHHNKMD